TLILDYGKEVKIKDVIVSLHKAKHIIGAAQVLVIDEE
ncbi:MAG: DNA ligase-associated DEXH box helicase, partial [Thermoprotei archaeon]